MIKFADENSDCKKSQTGPSVLDEFDEHEPGKESVDVYNEPTPQTDTNQINKDLNPKSAQSESSDQQVEVKVKNFTKNIETIPEQQESLTKIPTIRGMHFMFKTYTVHESAGDQSEFKHIIDEKSNYDFFDQTDEDSEDDESESQWAHPGISMERIEDKVYSRLFTINRLKSQSQSLRNQ